MERRGLKKSRSYSLDIHNTSKKVEQLSLDWESLKQNLDNNKQKKRYTRKLTEAIKKSSQVPNTPVRARNRSVSKVIYKKSPSPLKRVSRKEDLNILLVKCKTFAQQFSMENDNDSPQKEPNLRQKYFLYKKNSTSDFEK